MAVDTGNGEDTESSGSLPPRKSPRELSSLADVRDALDIIQLQEVSISASLASLLAEQDPIVRSLEGIGGLLPEFGKIDEDAISFSTRVGSTAKTAQRISNRVSSLDEEMRRIKGSIERVSQVMELKTSLQLLQSSMESRDYDSATRHCARAMSVPSSVISGQFAESVIPTPDAPLPPVEHIQTAREQLLETFRKEFRQAAESRDAASASRFFKLFPMIGWENEGLEIYSEFVVDLLRTRPSISIKASSPMYYITSVTALLEHVAHIIDQHQPVVEKHYGNGRMTFVALKLIEECDHIIQRLLDGWEEERATKRKLQDVNSWSPMRAGQDLQQEDTIDARELDKIISEAIGMTGRWTLFQHFLVDRLIISHHQDESEQEAIADRQLEDPLNNSSLQLRFHQLLISIYLPLETWYLKFIIERAHKVSTVDPSSPKPVSTVPDDVFYILKLILSRMLSSGDLAFIKTGLSGVRTVMEQHFIEKLKHRLDSAYIRDTHGGGREKFERENQITFITHLNDLETSASHMERLIKDIQQPDAALGAFMTEEVPTVSAQLQLFHDFSRKLRTIVKTGIEQLFSQLTRPRLRQFIPDLFKDISYVLTENNYSSSESRDLFTRRFVKAWELQTNGFKRHFIESNFDQFFNLILDSIVRSWERQIQNMKFNELGAIRLDRDIRSVMAYLSSAPAFGGARDKFRRLQHISTLLNLDLEDDVDEFYSSSGVVWSLSLQEARSIVSLRV